MLDLESNPKYEESEKGGGLEAIGSLTELSKSASIF